ncbi:MAG: hypothetical protein RIQ89_1157 [Bacteroidota bacterium]|jgi:S-adenosylmethionine:tRNA ribosyltransferase-isomerase
MNHPQSIHIHDYSYQLPDERIALFPLAQRDQSKLLHYKNGAISETIFAHLPNLLPDESLLVFNNTRVVNARLFFQRPSGAVIEIFCLNPAHPADYAQAFEAKGTSSWWCLVGNNKKWKHGEVLSLANADMALKLSLTATRISAHKDGFEIKFDWNNQFSFEQVMAMAGNLPLPPYLNRKSTAADEQRYQTIFAAHTGSVAAPTAGLHFTEATLQQLKEKKITTASLTLHVGAGTFMPVKATTLADHIMHSEYICITIDFLKQLLHACENKQPVIAVGTTSVRTLESIYFLGANIDSQWALPQLKVSQWMPYEGSYQMSPKEALIALITHMQQLQLSEIHANTQIIIAPGYNFKFVNGLITNFHQPQNTLLLLVAAFVGSDWKSIYQYAMDHHFRFLSYGDSSLLWRT